MKRILSAALVACALVGVFAPDLGAIRRKEERQEDAQRAIAAAERGDFLDAIRKLAALDMEDPYEYVEHDLRAGRKDQSRDDIQDFKVERDNWSVRMRKLLIQEVGNPGQILCGRMGPDNAEYNHENPREPRIGENLCHIAWRAWNEDDGWPDARVAQLYSRYAGRGKGSLILQTSGEDRFIVHNDGVIEFTNVPVQPAANGQVRVAVLVNGAPMWLLLQPR